MTKFSPVFFLILFSMASYAQERRTLDAVRTQRPPAIDGLLDDEVWLDDPLALGDWLSYNPLYGETMEQRTEVRIAYDEGNLYFAFRCFDKEPEKVRTTISRRDAVFNDDWVGLSLDSAGTGQTAYHLIVNPSGIQMDAINTSSAGERWEADLVWHSAGRRTSDGYIVEIRLPLESIRFKSGDEVRMGILFWRRISRMGVSSSWPDLPPGQWVFNRHAVLLLQDLEEPRLFELLPSITYGISQTRATPDRWNAANDNADVGFSAKYGLTSGITLEATVNPDFSQVESDAFQVQVNQRFPVFFSEKRPFFMEGLGLFSVAGSGGDGNMRTAVHTRRIINPSWGTKLTGTLGKMTFGILSAADETPEDIGNRGVTVAGKQKLFTIGRANYSLGQSNYAGLIFTGTEHGGRTNRVTGGDLSLRYNRYQQLSATFLQSTTATSESPFCDAMDGMSATGGGSPRGPDAERKRASAQPQETAQPSTEDGPLVSRCSHLAGAAAQVSYGYFRRAFGFLSQVEHYDPGFQMDTAFYNRTGFTAGWTYAELNYYPKDNNKSWLKRVTPFIWGKVGRDRIQRGNEHFSLVATRMNFTRQGFVRIHHGWGHEAWAGQQFKNSHTLLFGNVQLFRWLQLNGNISQGFATFYDPVSPFQGRNRFRSVGVTLQPNPRINQNVSYNKVEFTRASNGERVYTVHIVNTRSTYQFNRHFLTRALVQYDSSRRRILTDFLASYEFVPGTVLHAGYGSLIEQREFRDGTLLPGPGGFLTVHRSFFLKASYLHRF